MSNHAAPDLIELTVETIAAYVSKNSLPAAELPALMKSVYDSLAQVTNEASARDTKLDNPAPPVSIKKSVTDEHLICLEDGRKFKSLKRHLMADYGLTPEAYRAKWGLPPNYPMVAPAYARSRSALALSLGLGRKTTVETPEPVKAEPEPTPPPVKAATRKVKAAATSADIAPAAATKSAVKPARRRKVAKAA